MEKRSWHKIRTYEIYTRTYDGHEIRVGWNTNESYTYLYVFEAVDKTLRDICNGEINTKELLFGGKVIVLDSDLT